MIEKVIYPCYIADKYIFAEIPDLGRALIDSGSFISISDVPAINILDKSFSFKKSIMGQSISTISDLIGTGVNALIGSDILTRFDTFIDIEKGELTLSNKPLEIGGESLNLNYFMNIPSFNAEIEGESYKFLFDTGAVLSYINNNIAEKYEVTGEDTDFYPGFGKFKTETRRINTKIGSKEIPFTFGTLPEILELSFGLTGADGIIGSEIFEHYNVVISKSMRRITFVGLNS